MKSFSLVIPTLNEQKYISKILKDIQTQSLQPNQVIVVDGYSSDNTRQIIRKKFPTVTILSCPPNVSSQRNYGAKNITDAIIIFLDADTGLRDKDFFLKAVSSINNHHQITCPYYLPFKSTYPIFFVYLFFNSMFFLFQKISASGAGSCIIITKKLFTKLNGFNPDIKFEDIELIRRASKHTNFSMLPDYIWVSDRRFKKYGIIHTTLQYLILSAFFLFNQFNYSAGFSYQFGKYSKK